MEKEKLLDTLSIIKESISYSMFSHNEDAFVERAKYDIANIEKIEKIIKEYEEIKQFAVFGVEVCGHMSTFAYSDKEMLQAIFDEISKYKKVELYYDQLIGTYNMWIKKEGVTIEQKTGEKEKKEASSESK